MLPKESLVLTTPVLMQCLGVCPLLLFPHSLLVMLTQHGAGAGTAVALED